jgi:hypothetical protein
MADRYGYARRRVARIIKRWKTGDVTLTRTRRAAPEGDQPGTPGEATLVDVYTLDARVNGVAAEYLDGTETLATDLMVIASPDATLNGAVVYLEPRTADILQINGEDKVIKRIEAVPASGPAARFHIFVAS